MSFERQLLVHDDASNDSGFAAGHFLKIGFFEPRVATAGKAS
jgi:hypothetical protein